MFHHIRLLPFIFGIVLGIVGILFAKPAQNIIYKYPTPDSAGKIVYKDKNGVCYTYQSTQVDCDKNENRLKEFPLTK